ncbi:hypothetical protein CK203_112211 [Vitis vinifera]|uniref:DUF4283 domain-containing protein n=1 Tax=Vitis vinifera TaxID=29760 RepID=A0A438D0G3_VITVI|nr:hypothetical protein CK203_112211 [Vitis vinifera]
MREVFEKKSEVEKERGEIWGGVKVFEIGGGETGQNPNQDKGKWERVGGKMGESILWCGMRTKQRRERGVELHGGDVTEGGRKNGKKRKSRRKGHGENKYEQVVAEMVKGSEGRGGEVLEPSLENGMDMERLVVNGEVLGVAGETRVGKDGKGRSFWNFSMWVKPIVLPLEAGGWEASVRAGTMGPRCGCEDEGGSRKEVWVKILGLPVSLWVPSICGKWGTNVEVCSHGSPDGEDGGSGMGSHPSKRKNGGLPSRRLLEAFERNYREEVRGDDAARAIPRVGEEESKARGAAAYADEMMGSQRGDGDGTGKWARAGYGAVLWIWIQVDGLLHQAHLQEAGLGIGPSYSKQIGGLCGESPDCLGVMDWRGIFRPVQPESRKGS